MSDSWKDYAGSTRVGDKNRMQERVRKACEMEKRLHQDGGPMDVPFMTEMAHKYITDKEDREKFIKIVETMAINPDLITEEQYTFYYDGHEHIDCAETVEGDLNLEENDDDE